MALNDKKSIFGWAMYDWANSAFATTIMAGFFPIFFNEFWSVGVDTTVTTARLGLANSIAGVVIALSAPVLGAIADKGTAKKRFLIFFAFMGVVMTCGLFLAGQGNWLMAVWLYVFATIGFSGSNIFYDSLISAVASEEKLDFVSSLGYSLGYLGGGVLFSVNVWMTLSPATFGLADASEAVRFSFLTVGVWWALFSIPVLLFVKEPEFDSAEKGGSVIRAGLRQLKETFEEVRHLKTIFTFLLAYWFYIDGVDTIVRMAVDYGKSIGFESKDLITALLLIQFVGFPSAIGFGYLGGKIGARRAIYIAISVYVLISIGGAFMTSIVEFYVLATMVGLVQGGIQALSRSFYARIIPVDKSAEYFGFYNMLGKFAVVIGPFLMSMVGLFVRSIGFDSMVASRIGISSISLLLIAGGVMFYFVDEEKGRAELKYLTDLKPHG